MKHLIFVTALLVPGLLSAQDSCASHEAAAGHERTGHEHIMGAAMVNEPGQGAFAAIGEVVSALASNPETDWSRVNIDALRGHLVDMDMVVTHAQVASEATDLGMRFMVSGEGGVAASIQRMVVAHARVMEGAEGWSYQVEETETGAILGVSVPELDKARLNALGFFGILTAGMHHQEHHWMMANGMNPHH